MKRLPLLALCLAASAASHADVFVEQKIESAALNGNMVMKVKGDQARMDMPSPAGEVTVIMNVATGEMTTLMHTQKMSMKMNLNAIKQQTEAAQKQSGVDPSKLEKPTATGVMEKVGEWTAEIYEFKLGGVTGKLWVAKDFPNAQSIKDQMKKLNAANAGGFDPNKMEVPGMIVKTQMTTPVGAMTTTLLKAEETPVAETEFALPTGYQEMKMPTPPGAAPK
jgi:hypothetical protein